MPIISSPNENVTLCPESEDWDWWLKLSPEARGASVRALRKFYQIETLSAARGRFLPGLRASSTEDIQLDINIDFIHDHLWVKGYNLKSHKSSGFAITRMMIVDRLADDEFKSKVSKLIEHCSFSTSE